MDFKKQARLGAIKEILELLDETDLDERMPKKASVVAIEAKPAKEELSMVDEMGEKMEAPDEDIEGLKEKLKALLG